MSKMMPTQIQTVVNVNDFSVCDVIFSFYTHLNFSFSRYMLSVKLSL